MPVQKTQNESPKKPVHKEDNDRATPEGVSDERPGLSTAPIRMPGGLPRFAPFVVGFMTGSLLGGVFWREIQKLILMPVAPALTPSRPMIEQSPINAGLLSVGVEICLLLGAIGAAAATLLTKRKAHLLGRLAGLVSFSLLIVCAIWWFFPSVLSLHIALELPKNQSPSHLQYHYFELVVLGSLVLLLCFAALASEMLASSPSARQRSRLSLGPLFVLAILGCVAVRVTQPWHPVCVLILGGVVASMYALALALAHLKRR